MLAKGEPVRYSLSGLGEPIPEVDPGIDERIDAEIWNYVYDLIQGTIEIQVWDALGDLVNDNIAGQFNRALGGPWRTLATP